MINTPKMNENLMIGTAILSTFSTRSQKDSIDLLLPFVKYCLQETYSIGDAVNEEQICEYLQGQFAFANLPLAIVHKALNRLSKSNGCIEIKNKQCIFANSVESDHYKIK